MRAFAFLITIIASSTNAEVMRGTDAVSVLGQADILTSSVTINEVETGILTEDNKLLLASQTVLSLVKHANVMYMCEQSWEKVTGGNGDQEPHWRQKSVVCSN